ncbi:hypothetical protein SAMN05444342_4429 [Haladaptatus paucihalophilus DX253]|uniref:DUF2209 domain-containing protein n=1 Tax=Haladaptatus paucihalophilus DX253 TaxID=797209 RepID=A0A1M7CQ48_HALPU|nr:DUF2209 family protein [Haladaptatus paucihalophilus]SHL69431.1 hypothetical protein SAMN05444342_4429 [Haladaptatus paucihalophilus DX253]
MVGIDISGRHEEDGEYLMVAAAVHATVGTTRLHSVQGMGFAVSYHEPTLSATTGVVAEAVSDPSAEPIVAERGEFYEEPEWMVEQYLEPDFKYVESIAERETVQAAHHAAYAARKLLL